jgi:RHS repeat-associated protein
VASCSTTITDRCNTQVLTHAATGSSTTVALSGKDSGTLTCTDPPLPKRPVCNTIWDIGSITVTISAGGSSFSGTGSFRQLTTPAGLAQAISGSFPPNSFFTVGYTTGASSFTVTSTVKGSASNFPISYSISSAQDASGFGISIGGGNFNGAPTGGTTLIGGTDDVFTTKYDTGTITAGFTANGTSISEQIPYGQTDTPATLAQALLTKFSQDTKATALVNAGCTNGTCSDGLVNLTTIATGAGTSYPLTLSAVTNSANFPSGSTSFTATSPSSSFVPGQPGTLYDNGTVTATLNGFTDGSAPKESVSYSQGSTPAGIAASLVAKMNADPLWGAISANVPAGSATITFTASAKGTDANSYSLTISGASNLSSSFPNPSFPNAGASTPITAAFSGGSLSTPSLDPSVVLTTVSTYDPLGRLLQVQQGQQTRTYSYDGLGQLLSAKVPETSYNPVTLTYKDFGPVATVTDPRGITSTSAYDSLGRLVDVKYSDGTPEVTFAYGAAGGANNGGGRLVATSDGAGLKSFQYDVMGNVTNVGQSVAGATYTTQYSYNAAGDLNSITYPSGRVVTKKYDGIGRFTEADNNGVSVYSVGSYSAAGQILSMNYGNGMAGQYGYNSRLQLAAIRYGNSAGSILDLGYSYGGAGNNGQIQSITDNLSSARSTSYVYDELGRLNIAQTQDLTSANTWKLKFSYDRYGNRLSEIPVGGTASMPMNEVFIDPTTNRITSAGYAYDAAGNMTSDGAFNYSFNVAGEMTSVVPFGATTPTATFGYDSNGLRVIKNGTVYIYSGRKVIAEYASGAAPTSPTVEHIYGGDLRLATIASGVMKYHYADHLSVRVDTDSSGNVVRNYGSYPFGETWYETGPADKWKFTSYENDSESGLNYAMSRFQSPRLGRFMGLDPLPGHLRNPQSLNRYSYVTNDPISLFDPTGMEGEDDAPCGPFENCDGNFAELQDDPLDLDLVANTDGLFGGMSDDDLANHVPFCGICVDGLPLPGMFDPSATNTDLTGGDVSALTIPSDSSQSTGTIFGGGCSTCDPGGSLWVTTGIPTDQMRAHNQLVPDGPSLTPEALAAGLAAQKSSLAKLGTTLSFNPEDQNFYLTDNLTGQKWLVIPGIGSFDVDWDGHPEHVEPRTLPETKNDPFFNPGWRNPSNPPPGPPRI